MKYTIPSTMASVVLILSLSYVTAFAQTPADLIKKAQEQKNIPQRQPPGGGNSSSGDNSASDDTSNNSRDEERAARKKRLEKEAEEAEGRRDYGEAIRLARESMALGLTKKWKAEMKEWIRGLERKQIAVPLVNEGDASYNRGDKVTALALYRRALATDPTVFSEKGLKFVKDLEVLLAGTDILPAVPLSLRDHPKILKYQEDWKYAKAEKELAESALEWVRELRKKPGADQKQLDVREAEALNDRNKAKSKQDTAVVKINEFVRTHD
jgi:tetratricopeptide (TPR) repeat protein